jgi:hypothetical protein
MIYKMPSDIYNEVTIFHSPDKKGVHANSELDLDDFAKIIQETYGLKDLGECDFPEDDNDPAWLTPGGGELYHYKIVDKKLFTWFLMKWS